MRYSKILAREGHHKNLVRYSQAQVTGNGRTWKHQGPANCGNAKEKNEREKGKMRAIAEHLKQVPIPPPPNSFGFSVNFFPFVILVLFYLPGFPALPYFLISWWHFPYFLPSLTQEGPHLLSLRLLFIGTLFDRPVTTHCSDGLTIANSWILFFPYLSYR